MVDMTAGTNRAYGGVTAEDRVAARRRQLVDTAIDVMAAAEWRSVTVAILCRNAGLNKRYFYESFADLDELAEATVDFVARGAWKAVATADAPVRDTPVRERTRVSVSALVRYFAADPRQARVLYGPVSASAAVSQHRVSIVRATTQQFVDVAREVYGAIPGANQLARTASAFVSGGTGEAILQWLDDHPDEELTSLIDDLTTLWVVTGVGAAEEAKRRHLANEM